MSNRAGPAQPAAIGADRADNRANVSPIPPTTQDTDPSLAAPAGYSPVQALIVRHRYLLFAIVAIFFLISFNGQWRVGRDSALYRGLGHSIATGQGYTFNGERHDLALPGYPVMLAGMERLFGSNVFHPVPQLVVMVLMAAATLALVYRLLLTRFAPWVAVAATVALGLNWKFLQQANELMTDIPFLLASAAALYGFEKLCAAQTTAGRLRSLAWILPGLAAAAALRPTFYALAGAWAFACLWGLLFARKKSPYLWAGGVLVVMVLIWFALDPRTRGMNPMAGGYEQTISEKLARIRAAAVDNDDQDEPATEVESPQMKMLRHHLPEAIFGIELWYFSIPVSLFAIAYGVMTARRQPLWGVLVLLSALMFALFGSQPRYFLMILPILFAGWMVHVAYLARWIPTRWRLRDAWYLLAVGFIIVPSVVKSVRFAMEQHGLDLARDKKRPDLADNRIANFLPIVRSSFRDIYRDGKFEPIIALSQTIAREVPDGERTIGPEPRIMTYLSGKPVFSLSDRLERHRNMTRTEAITADHITWAVLPAGLYGKTDPAAQNLLANRRDLELELPGFAAPGMKLVRFKVVARER